MATSSNKKGSGNGEPAHSTHGVRSSHFGTLFVVYVGLLAMGSILLFRPRPIYPDIGPGLPALTDNSKPVTLGPEAMNAFRSDAAEAARVAFGETARAEAESLAGTPPADVRGIQRRTVASVNALEAAAGPEVIEHLRNVMSEKLVDAVLDPTSERPFELIGGFLTHLTRYGVFRLEKLRAPRIVLRALAKARWNAMAGRELSEGFSKTETQAYWGWLAFHAEGAEIARRLTALNSFEAAGGTPTPALRSILLARLGAPLEAANLMDETANETQNLRLRNHALALVQAAAAPGAP